MFKLRIDSPISFSSLPGIRSEQKLYFGHIAINTSDLSRCSLPAARDGSGGGLQGHCVGYPACQSNVRAVRCVSLLQISSPTGGKDSPVIKNSHGGRCFFLPSCFFFIFAKTQCISSAVKLSACLLPCVDVTSGMTEWREAASLRLNEDGRWWPGGQR